MRRRLSWLAVIACPALIVVSATAASPLLRVSASRPASAHPAASAPVAQPANDEQALLDQLGKLSEYLAKTTNSPDEWRYHLAQGDILIQLAVRSQGKDRDELLRRVVDCHFSGAVLSPANQPGAWDRLAQLPGYLTKGFPGTSVVSYAAFQVIQAEHVKALAHDRDNPNPALEQHRARLIHFVHQHPTSPEAPAAILEAGKLSETLGRTDDARRCYRHVADGYAGQPQARQAGENLRRLGLTGESMQLKLPALFPTNSSSQQLFDLEWMRGRMVIVYFWSSTSAQATEDLHTIKQIVDRYSESGLRALYVNMDSDPNQARTFLAGRVTTGEHVIDTAGMTGAVAERYGIQALPHVLLVGRDGNLLPCGPHAAQLEQAISAVLPRSR